MIKEIECLVRGLVQGVMYRDFVRRTARRHNLSGTVENLAAGSVRIIAQGEENKLQDFLKRLRRGSLFSRIDSVEVIWRDQIKPFDSFEII